VAQQSLFKSTSAAQTHGHFKANASQLSSERSECPGEDLWKILITITFITKSQLGLHLNQLKFA
jgi:hypothetical protein